MMDAIPFQDTDQAREPIPLTFKALAVYFLIMMGGGLQTISNIYRPALWASLGIIWILIAWEASKLPLSRLIRPSLPFAIWVGCYYIWGVIVSPVPVFALAIKMTFYFSMIASGILVITSRPSYLETFATYVQAALVLNLAVTLLLVAHPEYSRFFADPEMAVTSERLLNTDRFAGLWGNANQAGFASLFMIVISAWARPVMRWVGRISGVTIIYLTASRQSTWLFILLLGLYLVIVLARSAKRQFVIFALCACAVSAFLVLDKLPVTELKNDPRIARVLDIHEHETRAKGANSRLDWLKIWMPYLIHGPWHGHGLASMAGSDTPMTVPRTDVPFMGIHNLYFGLWADVGILGLITFLLILGRQVIKAAFLPLTPTLKWAAVSLALIVVIDSFVKHTLLYDMDGMAAYALLFILPGSPAMQHFHLDNWTRH
jgi:hypothetical protein